MATFDLYAAYYDLLYRDKDYRTEADYVAGFLSPGASILELGCGTGGHAVELAARGHAVHGIDVSAAMVERAQRRRLQVEPELQSRLHFDEGDVRTYRTPATFDAVVSLFHVMSYQTTNADLLAALSTARSHLKPGGTFFFDFWYGPGVLSDRPRHVTKEVADNRIDVVRRTSPAVHVNENRVDVSFNVTITARDGGGQRTVQELHPMRYLFLPELDICFDRTGFCRETAFTWLTTDVLSDRSWYACVAATAI